MSGHRGGLPDDLVRAAGLNYGADVMRAPLRTQERLYRDFMRLCTKHGVDPSAVTASAVAWWNGKAMKGPGVDW